MVGQKKKKIIINQHLTLCSKNYSININLVPNTHNNQYTDKDTPYTRRLQKDRRGDKCVALELNSFTI